MECIERINNWNIPTTEKEQLRSYVNEFISGKITGRVPDCPEKTIDFVLNRLKIPLEFLNVPFDKKNLTPDRLKTFFDSLIQNKIKVKVYKYEDKKSTELKPVEVKNYTNSGKKRILEYLRTYIKFRFKSNPDIKAILLDVIDVKIKVKLDDPYCLSNEDKEKLLTKADLEKRLYIEANLKLGTRAGEFHSLRMRCINLPDMNKGRKFIEVEIIQSKTKKRIVKVYDPDTAELFIQYYKIRESEGAKPEDLFFKKSHINMRQWLGRTSLKLLGHRIHPHQLRSSAVTLNANSGLINNDTDMNRFYGWETGTGTSRRYLNSNKIELTNIDKKAEESQVKNYNKELKKIEFEKNLEISELWKTVQILQKQISSWEDSTKWSELIRQKKEVIN